MAQETVFDGERCVDLTTVQRVFPRCWLEDDDVPQAPQNIEDCDILEVTTPEAPPTPCPVFEPESWHNVVPLGAEGATITVIPDDSGGDWRCFCKSISLALKLVRRGRKSQ